MVIFQLKMALSHCIISFDGVGGGWCRSQWRELGGGFFVEDLEDDWVAGCELSMA